MSDQLIERMASVGGLDLQGRPGAGVWSKNHCQRDGCAESVTADLPASVSGGVIVQLVCR